MVVYVSVNDFGLCVVCELSEGVCLCVCVSVCLFTLSGLLVSWLKGYN